jgi:hypothetical protein
MQKTAHSIANFSSISAVFSWNQQVQFKQQSIKNSTSLKCIQPSQQVDINSLVQHIAHEQVQSSKEKAARSNAAHRYRK